MLSVRAAAVADAAEVARVHVRSWQVAYRGLLSDQYLDALRAEDRAARYTLDRTGPHEPATILAVQDAVIYGFATTGPSRAKDTQAAGELLALYVDPDFWGRGAGRMLIAAARERLDAHGFPEAILWVLAGNERAERFYQADGWAPDGARRQQAIWGMAADEVRYRRGMP